MIKQITMWCMCMLLALPSLAANNTRTDLLTTTLGYDIIKQGEKLEADPSDIKETDLEKFKYVCNDASFKRDIKRNTEDFQDKVEVLCKLIVSL